MSWLNKSLILECLRELSDQDIQRRLWLSSGGEISSFTEAVEQLFTDSGLRDQLGTGETGLGIDVEASLLALDAQLGTVDRHKEPGALIDSPSMRKVRELASASLRLISAHRSDNSPS